ncbi:MAG TPA: cytochrome c [Candidatus Krumholzibacteria bacterium]|nr:cytochrome c [Candidatus Krumholzibacteria bacterium]
MERRRYSTAVLALAAAVAAVLACSAALDHPTPQDAEWAQREWPGTTVAQLAEGRALYVDKCSGCHNLHIPAEHSPEEWKGYVAYMTADAKITSEQAGSIARYLAAASARARGMQTEEGGSTSVGR